MLLLLYRKKFTLQQRVVIGQLSLVMGLVGIFFGVLTEGSVPDFIRGFSVGLSSVMVGISLIFNLSTLPVVRARFNLDV